MTAIILCIASWLTATDAKSIDESALQHLRTAVFNGSYTAAVHVRYHHGYAGWWENWDRASRLTVLGLSIFAFAGSFVPRLTKNQRIGLLIVGTLAFVFSTTLNVVPFGDWRNDHSVLAKQWSVLQSQWDKLLLERDQLSPEVLQRRVEDLMAEQSAIERAEPAGYNETYLAKCQDAENKFRRLKSEDEKPTDYKNQARASTDILK